MSLARRALQRVADPILSRVAHRMAAVEATDDATEELLFGPAGRLNTRAISHTQLNDLARQVESTTGVGDAHPHLAQAYRALIDLEGRCVGRIAGTTGNILGKLTAGVLLLERAERLHVLEIGTLFGVFCAGLHRQLLRYGFDHDIVIVDPLESVQIQPEREKATDPSGTPATEATVRANMRLAAVDEQRVRLVRGLSTDSAVQQTVGEPFDLIIIDGDHSQAGVAADLVWAESIAAPGAVIVMDDYGDPGWPGVETALEEHLAGGSKLELRGVVATSAFLTMPR